MEMPDQTYYAHFQRKKATGKKPAGPWRVWSFGDRLMDSDELDNLRYVVDLWNEKDKGKRIEHAAFQVNVTGEPVHPKGIA
jgi:hypothetical protein